jgi:SAM-dependent methyltransferase
MVLLALSPDRRSHLIKMKDSTLPGSWDELWSQRKDEILNWDYLSHIIYHEIRKYCPSNPSSVILEAGSGSGRISARLGDLNCKIVELDCSLAALRLARTYSGGKGMFLAANIRDIPIKDEYCNVVWSSGVIEHFKTEESISVMKELARITAADGQLITLVPYSRCLPYRIVKWIFEKTGLWSYGREEPLSTLKHVCEGAKLQVQCEYTIAFSALGIQNLQFIPGFRWISRPISNLTCWLYDLGPMRWYDQFSSFLFGGYLLVNIARKAE